MIEPDSGASAEARPTLRVVRGVPDGVDASVEIAALAAVLATRGGAAHTEPQPPSAWSDPRRLLLPRPAPGPDGWRRSVLPS